MKVNEELLKAALIILDENEETMNEEVSLISSVGCFGCGLGCSGTVGG